MKKCFFLLLTYLFVNNAGAQNLDFTVKWGPEIDGSRKSTLADMIGHDGSGIYATEVRKSVLTLNHYNNDFAIDHSLELDFEEDGKECTINQVMYLKGHLFVFYSYQNRKEKRNILMVNEVDKGTLKFKNQKKKIGEIDYSGNSKRNSGSFLIKVSRDSSKVLAYYALPDTKGDPEAFGLNVLDYSLNSLWEKSVTIPYKDGLFDIETMRIDNNGNVYMLGLLYKEKRKSKRNGQPNYTYEAFAYSDKGNNVKQYTISLDDRFITDMQIEILNNNMVCAGFYSQKGTFSIRGTYFLTIDLTTKEVKTKSFKEFGFDFISQNLSKKEAKKAKKQEAKGEEPELYEYDLDKLLIGKDGSAILIGEQYYVRVYTTTSYMNGRPISQTHYAYNYNDIIAVKIDAAGQIQWAEKVAKTQHTVDDSGFYSSYTLAIVNGKICFIFNDNPDNLDYDGEGRPDNYKVRKSVVVIVSLDGSGKQTKQPIFNSVDIDVTTRPKVCEQISNHEVILFGQRRKTQQFARLVFN